MKRGAMGIVALLLTLVVTLPVGAVERGPRPTRGTALCPRVVARYTLCQEGFADRVASVTVMRSKS